VRPSRPNVLREATETIRRTRDTVAALMRTEIIPS
jgi:hypothetical protein